MLVPHVFVDPDDCSADGVWLRGDVAHHLLTVLRRGTGDGVDLADGTGVVRHGVIRQVGRGQAWCDVVGRRDVPLRLPRVRVVCGLPRQRKLDEVVQRLTELGVDEIVPAHTERSHVRLEASGHSGRAAGGRPWRAPRRGRAGGRGDRRWPR